MSSTPATNYPKPEDVKKDTAYLLSILLDQGKVAVTKEAAGKVQGMAREKDPTGAKRIVVLNRDAGDGVVLVLMPAQKPRGLVLRADAAGWEVVPVESLEQGDVVWAEMPLSKGSLVTLVLTHRYPDGDVEFRPWVKDHAGEPVTLSSMRNWGNFGGFKPVGGVWNFYRPAGKSAPEKVPNLKSLTRVLQQVIDKSPTNATILADELNLKRETVLGLVDTLVALDVLELAADDQYNKGELSTTDAFGRYRTDMRSAYATEAAVEWFWAQNWQAVKALKKRPVTSAPVAAPPPPAVVEVPAPTLTEAQEEEKQSIISSANQVIAQYAVLDEAMGAKFGHGDRKLADLPEVYRIANAARGVLESRGDVTRFFGKAREDVTKAISLLEAAKREFVRVFLAFLPSGAKYDTEAPGLQGWEHARPSKGEVLFVKNPISLKLEGVVLTELVPMKDRPDEWRGVWVSGPTVGMKGQWSGQTFWFWGGGAKAADEGVFRVPTADESERYAYLRHGKSIVEATPEEKRHEIRRMFERATREIQAAQGWLAVKPHHNDNHKEAANYYSRAESLYLQMAKQLGLKTESRVHPQGGTVTEYTPLNEEAREALELHKDAARKQADEVTKYEVGQFNERVTEREKAGWEVRETMPEALYAWAEGSHGKLYVVREGKGGPVWVNESRRGLEMKHGKGTRPIFFVPKTPRLLYDELSSIPDADVLLGVVPWLHSVIAAAAAAAGVPAEDRLNRYTKVNANFESRAPPLAPEDLRSSTVTPPAWFVKMTGYRMRFVTPNDNGVYIGTLSEVKSTGAQFRGFFNVTAVESPAGVHMMLGADQRKGLRPGDKVSVSTEARSHAQLSAVQREDEVGWTYLEALKRDLADATEKGDSFRVTHRKRQIEAEMAGSDLPALPPAPAPASPSKESAEARAEAMFRGIYDGWRAKKTFPSWGEKDYDDFYTVARDANLAPLTTLFRKMDDVKEMMSSLLAEGARAEEPVMPPAPELEVPAAPAAPACIVPARGQWVVGQRVLYENEWKMPSGSWKLRRLPAKIIAVHDACITVEVTESTDETILVGTQAEAGWCSPTAPKFGEGHGRIVEFYDEKGAKIPPPPPGIPAHVRPSKPPVWFDDEDKRWIEETVQDELGVYGTKLDDLAKEFPEVVERITKEREVFSWDFNLDDKGLCKEVKAEGDDHVAVWSNDRYTEVTSGAEWRQMHASLVEFDKTLTAGSPVEVRWVDEDYAYRALGYVDILSEGKRNDARLGFVRVVLSHDVLDKDGFAVFVAGDKISVSRWGANPDVNPNSGVFPVPDVRASGTIRMAGAVPLAAVRALPEGARVVCPDPDPNKVLAAVEQRDGRLLNELRIALTKIQTYDVEHPGSKLVSVWRPHLATLHNKFLHGEDPPVAGKTWEAVIADLVAGMGVAMEDDRRRLGARLPKQQVPRMTGYNWWTSLSVGAKDRGVDLLRDFISRADKMLVGDVKGKRSKATVISDYQGEALRRFVDGIRGFSTRNEAEGKNAAATVLEATLTDMEEKIRRDNNKRDMDERVDPTICRKFLREAKREFDLAIVDGKVAISTPTTLGEATLKKVRLQELPAKEGLRIWIVDGPHIRMNVEPDFIAGGHHLRYSWIPEGEVWIDSSISADDAEVAFTIHHEVVEHGLMLHQGKTYEDAHAMALESEQAARKKAAALEEAAKATKVVRKTEAEVYAELVGHYGKGNVWTTDELRRDFEIVGFVAGLAKARRKSDGKTGFLNFTHDPRVYYSFG